MLAAEACSCECRAQRRPGCCCSVHVHRRRPWVEIVLRAECHGKRRMRYSGRRAMSRRAGQRLKKIRATSATLIRKVYDLLKRGGGIMASSPGGELKESRAASRVKSESQNAGEAAKLVKKLALCCAEMATASQNGTRRGLKVSVIYGRGSVSSMSREMKPGNGLARCKLKPLYMLASAKRHIIKRGHNFIIAENRRPAIVEDAVV